MNDSSVHRREIEYPDSFLVQQANRHIKEHYKQGRHHVACILMCGRDVYKSLHLDSFGHDICAEPTALVNALAAGETSFLKLVSVFWSGREGDNPVVVAPCGNCRQILSEYAPDLLVICPDPSGQGTVSMTASDLLPLTYRKPGGVLG